MKKAFSLLELVFIVVIFGIVSLISSKILIDLYENYIYTHNLNALNQKANLAILTLKKRLDLKIPNSLAMISNANNIQELPTLKLNNKNYIWIGKSIEAHMAKKANNYGYSSIIDLNSSQSNLENKSLKTPFSNLDLTDKIIKELSFNQFSLFNNLKPAIFFDKPNNYTKKFYHDNAIKITKKQNDVFTFLSLPLDKKIYQHYFLSHTAYLLRLETIENDVKLMLYYNFQPWNNMSYKNAKKSILVDNVETFNIYKKNENIHVKLCLNDVKNPSFNLSICKEEILK